MFEYTNKRGKKVKVSISRHAFAQFVKRYKIVFPDSILSNNETISIIAKMFSSTNLVKNLSRKERTRLKRHGDNTMFFRTSIFTFVVENAKIVTIELSDKNKRCYN